MNDNALEELSLAREPRLRGNSKEATTLVDALPKFSEWATGRKSGVDTDTLNKHVKQMVEVCKWVWRVYLHTQWFSRQCSEHMTLTTRVALVPKNLVPFQAIFLS